MLGRFFIKREGFTVVEMLIVLGITAVLSSLFVGYGVNLKDQISLFRNEAEIIQMLFRVKTFAIQVRSENGETACAYGLHIDKESGQYLIYNKKKPVSLNCDEIKNYAWNISDGSIGQIRFLDGRVSFDDSSDSDIVFIPPRPKVDLDSRENSRSFVICTSGEGINEFCRNITVNRVGQIDSRKSN